VTEPVDPELEILREAERRRGGCGAFLVGAFVTLAVFFPLMLLTSIDAWMLRSGLGGWLVPLGLMVGRVALAVACGVAAAKGFTRLRLRWGRKGAPPSP
jgi:hypothetical protein